MSNLELAQFESGSGGVRWDDLLDAVLLNFSCSTGTIHKLNAKDGLLHLVVQKGIPDHILHAVEKIPIGKGIAGAAAERREPVEICNLQQNDGGVAKPAAKDTKVSGSIAVAIESKKGDLLGTIGIGKFEPYQFSEQEKESLNQIATRLAPLV